MKAKGKVSGEEGVKRYVPIDERTYPQSGDDHGVVFHRFWCRPLYVVYEKYKNGVKLGYLVLPQDKEIFRFEQMVAYAEGIQKGEIVCRVQQGKEGDT